MQQIENQCFIKLSSKIAVERVLTHFRTYQFYNSIIKRNEPGTIPPATFTEKQLKKLFASNGLDCINTLRELREAGIINIEPLTKNGYKLYQIQTLQPGTVDLNIIKNKGRPLNEITSKILSFLRLVSFPPEIETSIYFKTFLKLKDKHPQFFFLVDSFSGRIHTPITNLHRHLRPSIILSGEQTVSFDVKTMQPLILGKLLKNAIGENEFSKWIDNGKDVYEMIMNKTGIKSRDKAKERFFQIAYGKPSNDLLTLFGAANWINWINKIKTENLPGNPHSICKPHSNLAWTLQTSEVKIMTDVWTKLIYKGIPFLTVHDEIIVPESHREQSKEIISDVLGRHFDYFQLNYTKGENT